MKSSRAPETSLVSNFEEHVMLAVMRTGADAYGMEVRRELESVTGRDVTIGSVYITLDRLEAKGFVASTRALVKGETNSRRVFAVTPAGARALAETRSVRDRLWDGIELRPLLRPARS
jgi:PadR family transcriptional regulator, regulatory protein PadR